MRIKHGTQYYTFWQTGLSGPHTYNSGDEYSFTCFITGDMARLALAKIGLDYMFEHVWELDSSRDFAGQIPEIFEDALVDRAIAETCDLEVIKQLEALKECGDNIRAAVGEVR